MVEEEIPVDVEEDNANDPWAIAVQMCDVVVPRTCLLASSIN